MICSKTGDKVKKGDEIARLYTNREEAIAPAVERYLSALNIGDTAPEKVVLIHDIVR